MANKPGINNLFNIFEGMNAFGAGPGARTRSLLDSNLITQDAIDKANRQSIGTGIVTGLASYLAQPKNCLLYTSPSPRDRTRSRMPSSA